MNLRPFVTLEHLESERFWGISSFLGVAQRKDKHTLHQEAPEVSQMGVNGGLKGG